MLEDLQHQAKSLSLDLTELAQMTVANVTQQVTQVFDTANGLNEIASKLLDLKHMTNEIVKVGISSLEQALSDTLQDLLGITTTSATVSLVVLVVNLILMQQNVLLLQESLARALDNADALSHELHEHRTEMKAAKAEALSELEEVSYFASQKLMSFEQQLMSVERQMSEWNFEITYKDWFVLLVCIFLLLLTTIPPFRVCTLQE